MDSDDDIGVRSVHSDTSSSSASESSDESSSVSGSQSLIERCIVKDDEKLHIPMDSHDKITVRSRSVHSPPRPFSASKPSDKSSSVSGSQCLSSKPSDKSSSVS